MSRSLFSFAQALKLVDDQGASAGLDRLLGGALFVGAAAAGPAALVVLSLVDPKNEATRLLAPAVDKLAAKARGMSGRTRQDLLVAAHTITVLSAFFDAVGRQTRLDLTEADKQRLAGLPAASGFVDRALHAGVPFPSAEYPLLEETSTTGCGRSSPSWPRRAWTSCPASPASTGRSIRRTWSRARPRCTSTGCSISARSHRSPCGST